MSGTRYVKKESMPMIRHSKILLAGFAVTFCLFALVIFPVSADTGADADSAVYPEPRLVNCLALLEEQGIDVTEIQAAFESGDKDLVQILMGELRDEGLTGMGEEHDVSSGGSECSGDRTGELKRKEQIEKHIAMIEEQGVDVADIRAAFERGDRDTVRMLFAELHAECAQELG